MTIANPEVEIESEMAKYEQKRNSGWFLQNEIIPAITYPAIPYSPRSSEW